MELTYSWFLTTIAKQINCFSHTLLLEEWGPGLLGAGLGRSRKWHHQIILKEP